MPADMSAGQYWRPPGCDSHVMRFVCVGPFAFPVACARASADSTRAHIVRESVRRMTASVDMPFGFRCRRGTGSAEWHVLYRDDASAKDGDSVIRKAIGC